MFQIETRELGYTSKYLVRLQGGGYVESARNEKESARVSSPARRARKRPGHRGAVIGAASTLGRMPGVPVGLRRYFDDPCSAPRCARARGIARAVVRAARDGCDRRAGIRVKGVSGDVGRRAAARGAPDLDFRAG